jgi:hypothetical protein
MNLGWVWYWKQREYAADTYAAELGEGGNLSNYLDASIDLKSPPFDIAAPYLLIEAPSSELRIDRLAHPENYVGTDRFNLRPFVVAALGLVVLLCVFPLFGSAFSAWRFGVGGNWVIAEYCRGNGCEPQPMDDFNGFDHLVTFRNDQVSVEVYGLNNVLHQIGGDYRYVDDNTVYVNASWSTYIVPQFSGWYEIEKGWGTLTLRSPDETIVLKGR